MGQLEGQTSDTPLAQGVGSEQVVTEGVPGATPEQTPSPSATAGQGVDEVRRLQSLADQRLADSYKAQARADALERQLQERTQSQPKAESNPFSPQDNYIQWNQWNIDTAIERAVAKVDQQAQQRFAGLIQRAQETQWQNTHPNIDLESVKAFASMRGIRDLDDAYTLMSLPQFAQQTYQNASSQALNQFRQPQQGATPVRGAEATGVRPSVTFADTLKAYHRDPSIANSWTPEFRADFDRELKVRYNQG